MFKIKKLIILPLIFVLSIVLTGCSGGGGSSAGSKLTLYWWRPIGGAGEETYKQIVQEFTSANSNIDIKIISKKPETYEEDALSALAAHQTVENAPDIISIPSEDLTRFVPQLTPAPDNLFDIGVAAKKQTGLSAIDYVKEKFEPIVAKTTVLDDANGESKLYGLPIVVDTLALFVNRDIMSSAANDVRTNSKYSKDKSKEEINSIVKKIENPPTTWSGLAEIIPYLTVSDGSTITRGAIAMGTSKNVERSYDILSTIMMQNGTQMTDSSMDSATFNLAQTGATSTTAPGEEAMKFYLRFSNPSDPLFSWNAQMPNSVDAFMQGQVAMIAHYNSLYVHLINEMPSLKKSIDIVPMPQISSADNAAGYQNQKVQGRLDVFAAPSAKGDANRQSAAWQFIRYITSREGSRTYLSAVKMPSSLKEITGKSKFDAFNQQKTIADTWFKGDKAMQVDQIFIATIDDAYTGRKSVLDALNSAGSAATAILQASKNKWSQN